MRTEAPYAEVLEAVRAAVPVSKRPPEAEWSFLREVAGALDLGTDTGTSWDRFTGQVRRALNKLADEGVLVKAAEGRGVRFYRPDEWRQLEGQREREAAGQQVQLALWGRLHDELGLHGFLSTAPRGKPVSLAAGDWLRLLQVLDAVVTRGETS